MVFQEKSGKRYFQFMSIFAQNTEDCSLSLDWGREQGATHIVRVSEHEEGFAGASSWRFAKVLKTVAHVMVEDIVWEKWQIRQTS